MSILVFVHGTNGCLVGDTKIDCPRDLNKYPKGIPIKDLVDKPPFLTYSWDQRNQTLTLSTVSKVWCTGTQDIWRAKLTAYPIGKRRIGNRSGGTHRGKYLPPSELIGTFDHPVLLCNGKWKKLGELSPGDSLKSLYRADVDRGKLRWSEKEPTIQKQVGDKFPTDPHIYWKLQDPIREQQFVCTFVNGTRPSGYEVHHVDENKHNHTPSNLTWKNKSTHAADHLRERNLAGTTGWQKTGVHPKGMLGRRHRTTVKRRISQTLRAKRQTVNHRVISVEYVGRQPVYDMTVEKTHNFVANGVFVHNSGKSTLAWSLIKRAGGIKTFKGGITYTHSNLLLIGKYHGVATGGMDAVHPYENVIKIMRKTQERFPKDTLVFAEGMVTPGVERCRKIVEVFDEVYFIHLVVDIEQCIKHVKMRRDARGNTKKFDPTNLIHKAKSAEYWAAGIEEAGMNVVRASYPEAERMCFKRVRPVALVKEPTQQSLV